MKNNQIKFKMLDTNNSKEFIAKTVHNVSLIEGEGIFPKAKISLSDIEYRSIIGFEVCEIRKDGELLFRGVIESIILRARGQLEINLKLEIEDIEMNRIKDAKWALNIIELFKESNPDLFKDSTANEFKMTGEVYKSSLIEPPKGDILEVDDFVIGDKFSIERSNEIVLDAVELELKASWIREKFGEIGLSNVISELFKGQKVNTITPRSLELSWPKFGDRIYEDGRRRGSNYCVGVSKLKLDRTESVPGIIINKDSPPLSLVKYYYNNKFHIFWDFDQYTMETLNLKVCSNDSKRKRKFKVNLRNVQEFIDGPQERSFFKSQNGRILLQDIAESLKNYLILSRRNIEARFELCHDDERLERLSCRDWIKFRGSLYKITRLEKIIAPEGEKLKITARGFGKEFPNNYAKIDEIIFPNSDCDEEKLGFSDIIESITVENEGDTQIRKLEDFIRTEKLSGTMTENNYKKLILSFLKENQTKIKIIAKPLKIKHCELKELPPIEIRI